MAAHHPYRTLNPTQKPSPWKSAPYRVARVENPPTSAVRQHDGIQPTLQDLKPNSEAVALEERTLRVARVENPPTSAVRQHDGIQSSLQDLKPNSEAVALEERTFRVARVENPPTSAVREHEGIQSSAQDIKPKSEAIASAERTFEATNRPAGTSIAHVENPSTLSRKTKKPSSPVTAKARIANATADQDLPGMEALHLSAGVWASSSSRLRVSRAHTAAMVGNSPS